MANGLPPESWKKIEEDFKHARGIGLALSATIITLSSATLAWSVTLFEGWQLAYSFFLAGAIISAVWFQFLLFRGKADEATARFNVLAAYQRYDSSAKDEAQKDISDQAQTGLQMNSLAQRILGTADGLALAMTLLASAGIFLLYITFLVSKA